MGQRPPGLLGACGGPGRLLSRRRASWPIKCGPSWPGCSRARRSVWRRSRAAATSGAISKSCTQGLTWWWARLAAWWIFCHARPCTWKRSRWLCSTKPTKCWTWDFARIWRPSSARPQRARAPICFRPPYPSRSLAGGSLSEGRGPHRCPEPGRGQATRIFAMWRT